MIINDSNQRLNSCWRTFHVFAFAVGIGVLNVAGGVRSNENGGVTQIGETSNRLTIKCNIKFINGFIM